VKSPDAWSPASRTREVGAVLRRLDQLLATVAEARSARLRQLAAVRSRAAGGDRALQVCAERDSLAVVHPLRTSAVPLPRLPARLPGWDGRAPAAAGPESAPTSCPVALRLAVGAAGGSW